MEQGGGGGDFSGGGEHNHALDMDMDEKQRQQDLAERAKQCEQHQEEVAAGKIRTVNYDTENHLAVLTQVYGSVWPRVLPYCLCNILITSLVYYLREYKSIDLTFSDRGHTFMSLMVSFLVVTRSNIAYSRFMDAREDLNRAMKACRELTQHMITFTRYETGPAAKQWRAEVARRTVVLLRTTVSVLEYETKGEHAWKMPELTRDEKQALILTVGKSNERVPMVLTVFLRSSIASQREYLESPMHVNKELRLYQFVSDFVSAYHGLMKLVTTPFPFPLVQMARTFLFLWVFTLPFAVESDIAKFPALVMIIFFVTYGFIGLELVSIELDNPFGDDPNDFDVLGLAKVVFEDIYLYLYDIDGKEAVDLLRKNIEDPSAQLSKATVAKPKHQRYNSIDVWNSAVSPTELKVGADRSQLLVATSERRPRSTSDVFRQHHGIDQLPVSVGMTGGSGGTSNHKAHGHGDSPINTPTVDTSHSPHPFFSMFLSPSSDSSSQQQQNSHSHYGHQSQPQQEPDFLSPQNQQQDCYRITSIPERSSQSNRSLESGSQRSQESGSQRSLAE